MKAVAVYPRLRELRLIECDEPKITEPTQAKLRMLEVGICGTDREICRFEYGTPPPDSEYLILGHESLGEVVEVGSAVDNLRVGDLVVTMVRRPCPHPHCRPCRTGHQDFCRTGDFTERGIKGLHGFMAEYVVDDSRYMYQVPADQRDVGVLVEPGTIAAKALFQTLSILRRLPWVDRTSLREPHDRTYKALVLGAGAVGLLGAMALRNNGFATYVYDRSPAPNPKSQLVQSIGATYVAQESSRQFAHLVGDVDLVYEATGASRLAFQAMRVLGPNSIFIFTGVPGQKPPSDVDTDFIMRNAVLKNQVILGTVNAGPEAFLATIEGLGAFRGRWPGAAESLITHRYPLEDFKEPLVGGASGDIKSVLTFH
ncbi:MAG: glucose dehydrogenase [Chloroflexi bacterium]|nr:MAG: glucose dehydrogenase [Chloroflexota bacterium]